MPLSRSLPLFGTATKGLPFPECDGVGWLNAGPVTEDRMHYSNIVIVKGSENLERSVESVIGTASEENGGWWDWYQVGGRWTGFFDGYEPDKDPLLMETCNLCGGSGKRTDMKVLEGCNGCQGKGKSLKWPTQWPTREQDAIPLHALTQEHVDKAYAVVMTNGERFAEEGYYPWDKENPFPDREKPPADWIKEHAWEYAYEKGGLFAVIVDNHC